MVTYEFEFFTPQTESSFNKQPVIELLKFSCNTEAENFAYNWLKARRAEIYSCLHPSMTKSERKEILSVLPLYHVISGRPIARNADGEPDYESRRW